MAKSKNNSFGSLRKAPSIPRIRTSSQGNSQAPRDTSLRTATMGSGVKTSPLSFGSFRSKATTSTQQGSEWMSLLQHATSGGIASAIGGDLSSITGLGGLVSGILGLFGGGKSQPPPLAQFVLPQSQQNTITLHQQPTSIANSQGNPGGTAKTVTGAYQQTAPALDHTQVVKVVRQALLNSSSLNDVISEI